MRSSVLAGIVVAVFIAATLAGISPYTSFASAPNPKQSTFNDQIAAQVALQNPNPTVEIQKGASQQGGLLEPFSPSIVNVHAGTTVSWVNRDSVAHTVTSALFDSGPISFGNQSTSFKHTFSEKGIFSYFCKIHPYMAGTVYVDTEETQRQLVSTTRPGNIDVKVEMPQNAAYQSKYGPFFIPSNAIVPLGAEVTWTNHDFIAHTATSSDNGSSFDTGPITPGTSRTLVMHNLGVKGYYCEIHPWMVGSITVVNPTG